MKRFFVTATGTEIGKTVITAQLTRQLRAGGTDALALKPVASGVDPERLEESDPGRLVAARGLAVTPETVREICPWRYAPAIAPDQAAASAGETLALDDVLAFCRGAAAEVVLVEGVGGVRVPLGHDRTVTDWIRGLACPALLVSGTYLGAISHLLTALDALRLADLDVAGIVLNRSEEEPMPVEDMVAAIRPFVGDLPVVVFPRLRDPFEAAGPDLRGLLSG